MAKQKPKAGKYNRKLFPVLAEKLVTFYDVPPIGEDGKANALPFLVDFCRQEGIPVATLRGWLRRAGEPDYKPLTDAWAVCQELLTRNLVTCALRSKYQPIFSIFAAKNMIGWTDKNEVVVEAKGNWAAMAKKGRGK